MIYLTTQTRPDIAFSVQKLGRFNLNPTKAAEGASKVLRYLQDTKDLGITFGAGDAETRLHANLLLAPTYQLVIPVTDVCGLVLLRIEPNGGWPVATKTVRALIALVEGLTSRYEGSRHEERWKRNCPSCILAHLTFPLSSFLRDPNPSPIFSKP